MSNKRHLDVDFANEFFLSGCYVINGEKKLIFFLHNFKNIIYIVERKKNKNRVSKIAAEI